MRVLLGTRARAEVRHLPPAVKAEVRRSLGFLEADGLDAALDLRRLSTDLGAPVYRIRVGSWRIVFLLRAQGAEVMRVFPRKEGYAWMDRP